MTADERFVALGEEVPPLVVIPGNLSFAGWRRSGSLIYLSGHGPNRKLMPPQFDYVGRVGSDLTADEGYQAARLCGLSLLVHRLISGRHTAVGDLADFQGASAEHT